MIFPSLAAFFLLHFMSFLHKISGSKGKKNLLHHLIPLCHLELGGKNAYRTLASRYTLILCLDP